MVAEKINVLADWWSADGWSQDFSLLRLWLDLAQLF